MCVKNGGRDFWMNDLVQVVFCVKFIDHNSLTGIHK